MQLFDTATELTIRAELPQTTEANDVLALVRSGVLRGLSIEFSAQAERLEEVDLRIVERAKLSAIGVVDRPQYSGTPLSRLDGAADRFSKLGFPMQKISIAAVTPGLATGLNLSLKRSLKRWQIQKTRFWQSWASTAARLHPGGAAR